MNVTVRPDVQALRDKVVGIRRDLHQHPELAFEEVRTAGVVAEHLRALGLDPRTGVARTGVSAVIEGAADGPTLLLRADMDALPVDEEADVPFRSTVPGKMHACGHDGHTAVLLGAAELLCAARDRLHGRVKLVFQPAEENPGGAKPMIDAGVLEDPHVDHCFGIHLWAPVPTGRIGVSPGPVMASSDRLVIRVTGSGGHAAMPHTTVDPVLTAAHLVTALQSIVSRNIPARQAAVVSITQIHAGETFNVIPDYVELVGTVRTFDAGIREQVKARIGELVAQLPPAFGARGELQYNDGYPVTVNDPAMAELAAAAAREVVGDGVMPFEPMLGAEDFAYFLQAVPGCFALVGAGIPDQPVYPHHNPKFAINEDALEIGMELMLRVAERVLGG